MRFFIGDNQETSGVSDQERSVDRTDTAPIAHPPISEDVPGTSVARKDSDLSN